MIHESHREYKTQNYGFKPANRDLSIIFSIIHLFIEQKLCKHIFYGAEHNKLQTQDPLTIQTFIH